MYAGGAVCSGNTGEGSKTDKKKKTNKKKIHTRIWVPGGTNTRV